MAEFLLFLIESLKEESYILKVRCHPILTIDKKCFSIVREHEYFEKLEISFEAHPPADGLREFFTSWVLPLILIFFLGQFFLGRLFKQGPPGLAAFGKSKARLVAQKKESTKFKDVAGSAEAKEELQEIITDAFETALKKAALEAFEGIYTPQQLQEKIKNSCDKLASALGLPNNLAPVAHGVRPQSASFNDYNMILHPIQHNQ
jgi:hypothetical protein